MPQIHKKDVLSVDLAELVEHVNCIMVDSLEEDKRALIDMFLNFVIITLHQVVIQQVTVVHKLKHGLVLLV